jgi:hypothetical protein
VAWKLLVAGLIAVCPMPSLAAAPWLEATTRHFRVYGQGGEAELRRFATQLEQYDTVLRRLNGLESEREDEGAPRLSIYILRDRGAVVRSMNSRSSYIYGYYDQVAAGAFAVVPEKAESGQFALTPQIILFHEYAHHFMLQNFPAFYSPWFVEGFAEFNSTIGFTKDGKVTVGNIAMHRLPQLQLDWGPPLTRLIEPGTRPLTDSETTELYGRAWLLVHYLTVSHNRTGQLRTYLNARADGADEEAAFQTAFHATPKQIDTELIQYYNIGRLGYLRMNAPPPPADLKIAPVSPAKAATFPLLLRLRHLQDEEQIVDGHPTPAAASLSADVRRGAADYPADADMQELVAETAMLVGDAPAAGAAAETVLRADPGNARALLVRAQLALAQVKKGGDVAALRAARRLVGAANHADPNDPLPLIAYYRSFEAFGETPPPLAVQGLARAEDLAPQDDGVRILLARQYAHDRRFAEAADLLRPIAFAPHASAGRDIAQKLLATLPIARSDAPPPAQSAEPAASVAAPAAPAAQPNS